MRPCLYRTKDFLILNGIKFIQEIQISIKARLDFSNSFIVSHNGLCPFTERFCGEVRIFHGCHMIKLHSNVFICKPPFSCRRDNVLDSVMPCKLLEYYQTRRVYSGQFNRCQRLAVVQPSEKLPDFLLCHILIVVNCKGILIDTILNPFRQLAKRHAANVLHFSVIVINGRRIGNKGKFIIQKFTDSITPLLTIQTVINLVFITCKVHSGDRIAIYHAVNQKGLLFHVPHKATLHRIVEVHVSTLHLISKSLCCPLYIKSIHDIILLLFVII